jgi:predicted molibdopterin-dependent oxidoreductase YjgC
MSMNQQTLDGMPHLQLVQLSRPSRAPRVMVELTVDGKQVSVPEGATILNACQKLGIEVPTLCWLETLKPVNVCRVCVVEVEGARVLVPSCSRQVEPGMKVKTRGDRVDLTRRLVLEMLASSVDLSTSPGMAEMLEEYDAKPERFGECETVAQPTKVDNDLYVRDYGKCVLCYKCVEACGTDHQNTFAIAVAGRGFHAHISTEFAVELPESACVYCGNCIAVCPTGALMSKREWELREAGQWDESKQTATDTVCPFCGVGCTLTLHVQDGEIVKATSPLNNDITVGNLCIKGRFGWRHVQNGRSAEQMNADASPTT